MIQDNEDEYVVMVCDTCKMRFNCHKDSVKNGDRCLNPYVNNGCDGNLVMLIVEELGK